MSKSSDDPDAKQFGLELFFEKLAKESESNTERNSYEWNYRILREHIQIYVGRQDLEGQTVTFDETNDRAVIDSGDGSETVINFYGRGMIDSGSPQIIGPKFTSPPVGAEKLMYLILPKDRREEIAGDLEEEYRSKILPKFGPGFAKRWYWMQVARSIGPILWGQLGKLFKLGIFAKVTGWLSEKIGS